jgi:hypothetical protein
MNSKYLPLAGLLIIGAIIGASGSTAMAAENRIDALIRANGINRISIIDKSNISNSSLIGIGKIIDAEIRINQIGAEIKEIAA